MDHAIEAAALTRMYGPAAGVDGIDLVVERGECFGFLGPNGAGKTTFIRLALGLVHPTSGSVAVMGHALADDRMGALAQVGYLPGELGLYPSLTGRRTLDVLARLHPRPPVLRDDLCAALDLDEAALRKRVRDYSRGMKQKLGLVAALQHDPPLAILDEPTGGLDPVIQSRLLDWLAARSRAGRTIFFSSHVLAEVEALCDRAAMVRDGRLLFVGRLGDLRGARSRSVEVRFRGPVDPAPLRRPRGGARAGGGRAAPLHARRRPGPAAGGPRPAAPGRCLHRAGQPRGRLPRPLRGPRRGVRTIYTLALERNRGRLVLLAIGFGLFEFVVGVAYASVDQNAIRSLVDALPPALRALAGSADIATATGYVGSGLLHPVALAIQAAVVISMGAAPARETEMGTAELVLARPLPPARWLAAHTLAMATALALVVLGGYIGALAAALAVADLAPVHVAPLAGALLAGYVCFLAVGGVTLLAASLVRTGARAVAWATGFLLVSYALDYLARLWTIAEPLGHLSIFSYLDPPAVLRRGSLDAGDLAALAALALVTAIAAHLVIERRDLTP